MKIDFVITWVDGNDLAWKKAQKEYVQVMNDSKKIDNRKERYRDWDNLRYWFRGVEQCAPWVRKIHFVTWGHIPKWLNIEHPKLNIVKHSDYIPQKFLPTFNSHTIEWNFHKISGLTENFVYFNDDFFLLKPVRREEFFRNGLPVDMLALQPDVANVDDEVMPYIYLNNAMVLAKYFNKYNNMKEQPWAYFHLGYPIKYFIYNILEMAFPRFTGFYTVHGPSPLKKSTFRKLWELEPELLAKVCSHKFRHKDDINQYVLREYQKLSGNFVPANVQKIFGYYDISDQNERLYRTIENHQDKIICINDSNCKIDFERIKIRINTAFQRAFPEKSSFEQ